MSVEPIQGNGEKYATLQTFSLSLVNLLKSVLIDYSVPSFSIDISK
jgi:hypothetical protein